MICRILSLITLFSTAILLSCGCDEKTSSETPTKKMQQKTRAPLDISLTSKSNDPDTYNLTLTVKPLVSGQKISIKLVLPEKAELISGTAVEEMDYAKEIKREYSVRYSQAALADVLAGVTLYKGNMKLAKTVSAVIGKAGAKKAVPDKGKVKTDKEGRKYIEFDKKTSTGKDK